MSDNLSQGMFKISKALRELPGDMAKAAKQSLSDYGKKFETFFVKKQLSGDPFKKRTGTLARGFRSNVIQTNDGMVLLFWTGTKYAPIHEFGGTISPKKAKWLCIPSEILQTKKAGVSRVQSPREVPNLHFVNLGAGRAMLVQNDNGILNVMFHLRKRVTIKPKLELRKNWSEKSPWAVAMMAKEANNVLDGKYEKV